MGSTVIKMSVTDTETTETLTSTANYIVLYNGGSNTVYVALNGTATTNSFPISSKEKIEIGLLGITSIHAICASGESTTLYVIAAGEL